MTDIAFDVFLSYSRRQFYFAESLVLNLEKAGIQTWFDVQQLGPGELWRDQVNEGLETSRGLVLSASQSAMDSKNVRLEWEIAKNAGKPIYIAVFEACEVPQDLQEYATAIVDMRGNFPRNMRRLYQAINGEAVIKDKVPHPNRFGYPLRLPVSVGVIALGILSLAVLIVSVLIINIFSGQRESLLYTPLYALLSWYLLRTLRHFLKRDFTYRQMLYVIGVTSTFYVILLREYGVLIGIIMYASFILTGSSFRWLPTGQAMSFTRRWFGYGAIRLENKFKQKLIERATPEGRRYHLNYAPEDQVLADEIAAVLDNSGNEHVPMDEHADHHIVLLTEKTPTAMLQTLVDAHPTDLIPIMATGVDARGAVPEVGELQFIDYRRQTEEQIEAVWLALNFPQDARIIYGLNVLPLSTSELLLPFRIRLFGTALWATSILYLLLGIGILLTGTTQLFNSDTVQSMSIYIYVMIVAILLGMLQLWVISRVYERRITYPRYRRWMIVLMLLSVLTFNFAIPQAIIHSGTFRGLKRWLPQPVADQPDTDDTLPSRTDGMTLRYAVRDVLVIVAIYITIFLIPS